MSFILDALKKSETDRQQQGSAEFAGVPTSNRREGPPRWLWILGALLAINLTVLLGLLFRPDAGPAATTTTPASVSEPAAMNDFADQVATARENAPLQAEPQATAAESSHTETRPPSVTVSPAVTVSDEPMNTVALPTIHEVRANGTVTLPDLHVDIHVYSSTPGDRFVFINMVKHNEGARLAEGPLVQEITPDGVVLNHDGVSFLLPRD